MNDAPRYASLGDYVRVVRDQRWLVILTTVLFAAAAYAQAKQETPMYVAEAALEYRDPLADFALVGQGAPVTQSPTQRAAIGARTATTIPVARRAARILGSSASPEDVRSGVNARAEVRSELVIVEARRDSPEEAARVANAFARAIRDAETADVRRRFARAAAASREAIANFPNTDEGRAIAAGERARVGRLDQLSRLAQPVEVKLPALAPASAVSPRTQRNTAIAAIVGFVLGIALAFLRRALDRRVRDAGDVTDVADYPVLGTVPNGTLGRSLRADGKREKVLSEEELDPFRIVRTNIDFLDVDRSISTILVTSPLPEEGKSSVALSIATTAALAGRRTLLLECDLRAPVMWKRLKINATPGLSDFLGGNAGPARVLQTVELPFTQSRNGQTEEATPRLVCITAGSSVPQPAELLSSSRFAQFFDQVSSAYDTVVLDTTPLLPVVDALELVQYADAVVLCVRAHQTTRDELKAARQALERLPQRPTGVVVTGLREGEGIAYGYYGYHGKAQRRP